MTGPFQTSEPLPARSAPRSGRIVQIELVFAAAVRADREYVGGLVDVQRMDRHVRQAGIEGLPTGRSGRQFVDSWLVPR